MIDPGCNDFLIYISRGGLVWMMERVYGGCTITRQWKIALFLGPGSSTLSLVIVHDV
jgi:hypothetical protein